MLSGLLLDLSHAFFSIPHNPFSYFLLAFSFENRQITWTRLPQGFVDSLTLFSQVLKQDLDTIETPCGSAIIQYFDNVLITSPDEDSCQIDSLHVLATLALRGHNASLSKRQFCMPSVRYLGHMISRDGKELTLSCKQAVLSFPKPINKKQIHKFLGAVKYCKQWIPNFALLSKLLTDLLHDSVPDPPAWLSECKESFESLKSFLAVPPALALPDYQKPFTLFVHKQERVASGVLTQSFGNAQQSVAYYSSLLDPVAQRYLPCLTAVAATAELFTKAPSITLGHSLTLQVSHAVAALLQRHLTQHLLVQRQTK